MNAIGPQTLQAQEIGRMKYQQEGESFREAMNRIAFGLKDSDEHYHNLRDILLHQRFLPGGRIQTAIGASKEVTPYNCLSGDTEIFTDHGWKRLDTLVGRAVLVLSPVSGEFEMAQAKSYGQQRLYKITFSNSRFGQKRSGTFEVLATRGHRWILQDERETTELQVDDIVKCADADMEHDPVGWAHGFIYGDGTKQREGKFLVRLCGPKATFITRILAAYPNARVTYPQSANGDPYVTLETEFDLKALPSINDATYLAGFVAGLLAADGCFSNRENDAHQFHGSEEIVKWVRDHLVLAGYAPCGRAHEYATEATNFGERNVPIWKQIFRRTDEHRGFRVLAIDPLTMQTVYCVEEPKHKQIVLRNGLRTGNCFVSGTIEDSFVDGDGCIMDRAKQAAATMRMGGGIGYDFSTLRPKGDLIRKLQSHSTGPISFMRIFNEVCLATASSGHRRGAQMGVLSVEHPDIEDFVRAKQNDDQLRGFNISIAITDEFMECALNERPFMLRFGGRSYREIDAADLWQKIMRSTWDWAEPGVIFIDTVNRMNNLFYCETIRATNPCGEQPLPPFGACLLGSVNLTKYLRSNGPAEGNEARYYFDMARLVHDIPHIIRAMDNVIDRAKYPMPMQKAEARNKRRMGIGVTGLANTIEACGFLYGTPGFIEAENRILREITRQCYLASIDLAKEKGAFDLYDDTFYPNGNFIGTLDDDVQEGIRRFGIRNSHLTSIAPTGTISQYADNVSSGLEPVFAYELQRTINTPDGPQLVTIHDYASKFLGVFGRQSGEVTAAEHVSVLLAAQRHIDSAVSKTCNVDGKMPWAEFNEIYKRAWEGGAKGCTTFNQDGQRGALLVAAKPNQADVDSGLVCRIDPETGRKECD